MRVRCPPAEPLRPRRAQTTDGCYSPREPWFTATNYGFDDAVHAWAEEAGFLAMARPEDATPANPHFMFLWEVGHTALAGGQQQLVDLANGLAEEQVETALTLQIILLVASAVLNFAYFSFYFSPWLKRTLKESTRAAELLSVLPKEIDVAGIIVRNFEAAHEGVRDARRMSARASKPQD